MVANAKEAKGSGTASATISTLLEPVNGHTKVTIGTDLNVTGKPAQFGRGVMQDVSGNLVEQFATSLARELENGTIGSTTVGRPAGAPPQAGGERYADAPTHAVRPSADAIDLLGAAGGPVARRGLPIVGGTLLGLVLGWLLGRRSVSCSRGHPADLAR